MILPCIGVPFHDELHDIAFPVLVLLIGVAVSLNIRHQSCEGKPGIQDDFEDIPADLGIVCTHSHHVGAAVPPEPIFIGHGLLLKNPLRRRTVGDGSVVHEPLCTALLFRDLVGNTGYCLQGGVLGSRDLVAAIIVIHLLHNNLLGRFCFGCLKSGRHGKRDQKEYPGKANAQFSKPHKMKPPEFVLEVWYAI